MTKTPFAKITPSLLASMLEVRESEIRRYAESTKRHYKPTRIRIVNGKERKFDVPEKHFKQFLKKLHNVLKNLNLFHPSAHGGIKKRSAQTSANLHCGKNVIFTRDIKNCFPSATPVMMREELHRVGFLPETAKLLSQLLTVRGRVPQGANTGTDAINLLFLRIDTKISRLCKNAGFVYTRYVDDCVISGKDIATGQRLIATLEDGINSVALSINQDKKEKNGLMVTNKHVQLVQGLLVHRSGRTMICCEKKQVALQVAKDYLDLCQELTPASITGAASLRKKLQGYYSYFKSAKFSIAPHLNK